MAETPRTNRRARPPHPVPPPDQVGGSATLSWLLSRRNSLYTGYTSDYVTTPNSAYRVFTQGANVGFQRQQTRYLNLRLGYGYRRSLQYIAGVPRFDNYTIDSGIGYRRPI